jgi:adenosine deaminase CECR1
MVDLDFLFKVLLDTPGIHFYASRPLVSESARQTAGVLFQYVHTAPPAQAAASIWTSEYVPKTLIPANVAADAFPDGGRTGFIAWLKDRTSIIEKESIEHHLGVDDVWRKLTAAFVIMASILYYEPILRKFIRKLLETLVEDGVQWVELREAFPTPYRGENQENCDPNFNNMIRHIGEEIENFKATDKGKNFWGARIIWTSLRGLGQEVIFQSESFPKKRVRLLLERLHVNTSQAWNTASPQRRHTHT